MTNRTFDGRPLNMGISGFQHYSTDRSVAEEKEIPVLTPGDLLVQVQKIRRLLNDDKYKNAIKLLRDHITDKDNPHNTTLDQFTQDIADVLYKEYLDEGGTGDKQFYLNSLFKTLHVASGEDFMSNKELDDNVLISVNSARSLVSRHEDSRDAHSEILDEIFPGTPPQEDPVFGIMGYFGISRRFTETIENTDFQQVPYSYITSGGYVAYCNDINDLPVDYSYGEGMIPCFGRRDNYLNESNNTENHTLFSKENVTTMTDAEVAPDKTVSATAIFNSELDESVEHSILVKNVYLPANENRTFSVFVKADKCRYFALRYKDLVLSDVVVNAIFDLKLGTCLCMNHMNRYSAEIISCARGWYRCCLTMYHTIGQIYDLRMTFFDGSNTDNFNCTFDSSVLGYVWGMQLETGINASPYIKTNGLPSFRNGVPIVIDMPTVGIPTNQFGVDIKYRTPKKSNNATDIRPVFVTYKSNGNDLIKSSSVETRHIGTTDLATYGNLAVGSNSVHTVIAQLIFPEQSDKYTQLVYAVDKVSAGHKINKNIYMSMDTGDSWIQPDKMYVGCDANYTFMEGYLKSIVVYPYKITKDESDFITGEEIYG